MPNPFDFFGGGVDRRLAVIDQRMQNLERKIDKVLEVQQQLGGRKLDQLLRGQQQGRELIMSEQEEVARLVAAVQANKDVTASIKTAFEGMAGTISDLTQKLQDAIDASDEDVSPAIKEAADALQANTEALQAAIPQLAQAVEANT